ncbi:MAG: AAA family ATPase, partial [Opitutales bacterium]
DEVAVVQQTTAQPTKPGKPIFNAKTMLRFISLVRKMPVAEDVSRYAVRLAAASRPLQDGTLEYVDKWVNWGAGLRAAQFLVLGAKARALILGNTHVTTEDIQALAPPVLRHRILVNYRAEAEGITTEKVIEYLLDAVPTEIK